MTIVLLATQTRYHQFHNRIKNKTSDMCNYLRPRRNIDLTVDVDFWITDLTTWGIFYSWMTIYLPNEKLLWQSNLWLSVGQDVRERPTYQSTCAKQYVPPFRRGGGIMKYIMTLLEISWLFEICKKKWDIKKKIAFYYTAVMAQS